MASVYDADVAAYVTVRARCYGSG